MLRTLDKDVLKKSPNRYLLDTTYEEIKFPSRELLKLREGQIFEGGFVIRVKPAGLKRFLVVHLLSASRGCGTINSVNTDELVHFVFGRDNNIGYFSSYYKPETLTKIAPISGSLREADADPENFCDPGYSSYIIARELGLQPESFDKIKL